MPRALVIVATFDKSRGRKRPRWVRNSSKSRNSSRVACFSSPSGMSDCGTADEFVDVFAEQGRAFGFGIEYLERCLRFAGQDAVDQAAIGGDDRIGLKVALHATAGIEDVPEQFLFRMDGHAGQFRADAFALARVNVALGAMFLEYELARGGFAGFAGDGQSSSSTCLRSALGSVPPSFHDGTGLFAKLLVGMIGQHLFLVER